jgi:large subunit ribosomal protein L25
MSDLVLNIDARPKSGTGAARAVRSEGKVPGVLYGGDKEPENIAIGHKELKKAVLAGGLRSHLVRVKLNGATQPVLVRDIQFDPVSDEPIHFDLYRVKENQIISIEVPVRFINDGLSPGIKRGGALNVVRHAVELDCPANAIPEFIEVDLEGLEIGASVHISAVKLPQGVRPTIKDRDFTVATIAGAIAAAPEPAAVAAAPAETEVIKKGKAEEGGEADAKGGKKG